MSTAEPLLSVRSLSVAYEVSRRTRTVVHDVSFDLTSGQVLALVGESGSGKTTTGHAILGLLPDNGSVTAGSIAFAGRELTKLPAKQWRTLRGTQIGLIPQDPTVSLDPVRRVGDQVADVLRLHTDLDAGARRDRVLELFELVGFTDVERRYRQYPQQLSGGMRQRALIAAAIAGDPGVVIADEPTSGLDTTVQKQVLDLIDDLRAKLSTSVVLITHDLGVAADRSDLLGVMHEGRLVELGPTDEIVADPQHPYTRRLLDTRPSRPIRSYRDDRPAPPETVIDVTGLRKLYDHVPALDGISFRVRRGETFSLIGESGSGKSTTARIITGLTPPTSGHISLLGHDVTNLTRGQFRPLRRAVQIVYQSPYSSFDPRFDVGDVVEEPLRSFQSGRRRHHRDNADRVVAALESVSLPADFAKHHPRELSGGQRQRVAIARALVLEPSILVLDEPLSALDVSVAAQILEVLQRLQQDRGLTYLFISHDLAVVQAISDDVAVLQQGRIVEQGSPSDVFTAPQDAYTQGLLEAVAGRKLATTAQLVPNSSRQR